MDQVGFHGGGEAIYNPICRGRKDRGFHEPEKTGVTIHLFSEMKDHSSLSKCSNLINTFSLLVSSISPARNTSSRIA